MKIIQILAVLTLCIFVQCELAPSASAQQWDRRDRWGRGYEAPERDIFPGNTFTFCRILYNSHRGGYGWGRRGGGCWTDYPDSDLNFPQRLSELTTIKVNRTEDGQVKHVALDLLDDDLFKYPFAYMLEVGNMYLSQKEAERLRDYLLRGGFLLVDDFWGEYAWRNFEHEFSKVFPPEEYPLVDIPLEHEIFHIVFELDEIPQIPGIGHWAGSGGGTSESGGPVSCKGVFDKRGRLMAVIIHNSDLGDGWEEEATNPQYFAEFSRTKAYPLGINIVVYAMTH
ncbi:MAG: DUF4159 domain-containing protein [bacterium]